MEYTDNIAMMGYRFTVIDRDMLEMDSNENG